MAFISRACTAKAVIEGGLADLPPSFFCDPQFPFSVRSPGVERSILDLIVS